MSSTADWSDSRHGDRVAVVLDDVDHRQLVDAGEVERLVEVALVRRALAQVGDRDRRPCLRSLAAQAMPVACRICVATGDETDRMLRSLMP